MKRIYIIKSMLPIKFKIQIIFCSHLVFLISVALSCVIMYIYLTNSDINWKRKKD